MKVKSNTSTETKMVEAKTAINYLLVEDKWCHPTRWHGTGQQGLEG
jgi:hypothetical protein